MSRTSQTQWICKYIANTRNRVVPDQVMDEARKCLVDWTAVCVGAYGCPEASIVYKVMQSWQGQGQARYLMGGQTSASLAAFVNATLSHCLDFDDTHIPSVMHASGPLWSAVLALGLSRQLDEVLLMKAFITGYELAARLGGDRLGIRLNGNGWHTTPVLAKLAVAAASSVLLGLDEQQTEYAIGIAATQASGLTSSFGTMAKPFQIGKVAMDGILAAELAKFGLESPKGSIDVDSSLIRALCQDSSLLLEISPFENSWEICRNSFKPYAACQLTHAAIDAAHLSITRLAGRPIKRIKAIVNPLATQIAGLVNASTPREGKFSTAFCIALALKGHPVTTDDFNLDRLQDLELRELASRVELEANNSISRTSAHLAIELVDGEVFTQEVEDALGSISNPLGWTELDQKFLSLVKPMIQEKATDLLDILHGFDESGSLVRMFELTVNKRYFP